MTPDRILGWSVEREGKHSHVIGAADVVVGTSSPATVTVRFSLCGVADSGSQALTPNRSPCARCLDISFRLAQRGMLPDMAGAR